MLKLFILFIVLFSSFFFLQAAQTTPDQWLLQHQLLDKHQAKNNSLELLDTCDQSCNSCFGPKPTQCLTCNAGFQLNERLLQCETSGTYGFNIAMKTITIILILILICLALVAPSNSKRIFYTTFMLSELQIVDALYYVYMDKPDFLREVLRAFSITNFSFFWNGLAGITESGGSESRTSTYFQTHQNIFPYFKELGITGSFIYLGGTAFFLTLTVFVLTWIYLILVKGFKFRIPEVIKHIFEWNLIIRVFLLFAFPLTGAVIQQIMNISFSTAQDVVGVICAIISIIFLVFTTWITTFILRRERLQETYSQYRYGALIDELELAMDNRSHYLHLLLAGRRAAIAVIITVIPQGLVQLLLIMALTIAALVFINYHYGFSDEDLLHFFLFKEGSLIAMEICLLVVYFGGGSSAIGAIFSVFIIGWIIFTVIMGAVFILLKNAKAEPKIRPCSNFISDKLCCIYKVFLLSRNKHLNEDEDEENGRHTSYLIVEAA